MLGLCPSIKIDLNNFSGFGALFVGKAHTCMLGLCPSINLKDHTWERKGNEKEK